MFKVGDRVILKDEVKPYVEINKNERFIIEEIIKNNNVILDKALVKNNRRINSFDTYNKSFYNSIHVDYLILDVKEIRKQKLNNICSK